MRFFNTGGPCDPEYHYMIRVEARLHAENVLRLIEQNAYFIVHAPRQTGKTTAMLELARHPNESGGYIVVLVSMEVGAAFPKDVDAAENAILGEDDHTLRRLQIIKSFCRGVRKGTPLQKDLFSCNDLMLDRV